MLFPLCGLRRPTAEWQWWATPWPSHQEGLLDSPSRTGLLDQLIGVLGKLLLHVVIIAILIFRTTDNIPPLKGLQVEATFYNRQWRRGARTAS